MNYKDKNKNIQEINDTKNIEFPMPEENKEDDPNKMKFITKKMIDEFSNVVDVLKKIYEYDIDYNKLKNIINSNPISNGIFIIF